MRAAEWVNIGQGPEFASYLLHDILLNMRELPRSGRYIVVICSDSPVSVSRDTVMCRIYRCASAQRAKLFVQHRCTY
jgi:hypothetical protein